MVMTRHRPGRQNNPKPQRRRDPRVSWRATSAAAPAITTSSSRSRTRPAMHAAAVTRRSGEPAIADAAYGTRAS
ncbi:MAG: hypothetical protein ACMVO3_15680 [Thalassobaculum sp.]